MTSHAFAPLRHARAINPVVARRALAVFVAAHGLAHLVGTTRAFSSASDGRSLDWLAGNWTISDATTLRALGVLWAVLALAFVVTAVFIWAGRAEWPVLLWWAGLFSLVVVIIALWASVIGVVVDLALLAVAWRAGTISHVRRPV
jgi:hypothetical protein